MTIQLDNINEIKRLDSQNMLGSIKLLGKQISDAYHQVKKIKLPANYKKINKIIICGMGGSALPAHVVKTLFSKELKFPVEMLTYYHLPGFVDRNTLVIISSYSGSTEEPVNAAKEAFKEGYKMAIITSGGVLAPWAKKNNLPLFCFAPKYNPCNQPRMGIGYLMGTLMSIFNKLGLIRFGNAEVSRFAKSAELALSYFGIDVAESKNFAKQTARNATQKTVWFVGAEHLMGNAHVAANQMNENGKRFAGYFCIPELNHHLLEGMSNPLSNKDNLLFILFKSKLYDPKIQKRFEITKDILKKNKINCEEYVSKADDRISQVGELLSFSSFLSYYTAIFSGIDPNSIPYVDYFKKELKK